MEIKQIIHLLRKRLLFLLAVTLLFGAAAYYARSHQSPVYEAKVMLSVGGYISSPNPASVDIRAGMELAQTYAVLAKTTDVLNTVITTMDLPLSASQLSAKLTVSVLPTAPVLQIKVRDSDRARAPLIANTLAAELIARSPANLSSEQRVRLDTVRAEIVRLRGQLNDAQTQLEAVNQSLQNPDQLSQTEWEALSARQRWLTEQITLISANLAQYMNLAESLEQGTNSLKIIEQASEPEHANNSNLALLTILGTLLGAVVATGAILMVHYFDDTFHVPADVEQLLSLPVLATIPRFGRRRGPPSRRLVAHLDPSGLASEKYRSLRTNLSAYADGQEKLTYLVTSAGSQDGKSITASNLAVTMAMAGYHVLLIDADFRRPKLHEIFQLPNERGLSSLFAHRPPSGLLHYDDLNQDPALQGCIQTCAVPGLRVITTGQPLASPAEWLGSHQMTAWFDALRASDDVDVILFDAPPALAVSDSAILASTLEIKVILVVRASRTRIPAALEAKALLEKNNAWIRGIVLNQFNPADLGHHYSSYYTYARKGQVLESAPDAYLLVPARKNHHEGTVREPDSQRQP